MPIAGLFELRTLVCLLNFTNNQNDKTVKQIRDECYCCRLNLSSQHEIIKNTQIKFFCSCQRKNNVFCVFFFSSFDEALFQFDLVALRMAIEMN